MKTALRKDLEPVGTSFITKQLTEPHFDPNWHFHPQCQLFLVIEGNGTRFIGDSIKPFGQGDLVLLGPNLPHLWRSDKAYFDKESGLTTKGIVVYFTEDFLGTDFLEKQEMTPVRNLFNNAHKGLEWTGYTRQRTETALKNLVRLPLGFERIISFLTLLNDLAHATDYRVLTSPSYTNTVKPNETDRIQLVHDYVLSHFPDTISLDTVSDLAGMTPPAFCRYFKTRANKTFSEFVSEVRIGHACKLLIDGKLNITQISFESGFRTLSNFNRQFKDITGQTPSSYVKTYRELS